MFKLVVLSVILAVAAARPGLETQVVYSAPTIVQEQGLAKIGTVVNSIPTAVSHQSSTVVHDSAHVVQPIVAPIVKQYASPVVHTYAAPIIKTISNPLAYSSVLKSYGGAPLVAYANGW